MNVTRDAAGHTLKSLLPFEGDMSKALIAIGGNSLIRACEKGTTAEQAANLQRTAAAVVGLLKKGFRLVLTHGNGPQVGAALLRSERSADQTYGQSLDVCDACTQGEIGYQLELALHNEIDRAGLATPVISVITQSVVEANDPAFQNPTKFIGSFYAAEEARDRAAKFGWAIQRDSNRGYRRVVASPEPVDIVEFESIKTLVESGALVIAAGGGGIPVLRTSQGLKGCEAVIDKDRASALLASKIGVDLLVICTDTECVHLDHGTLMQKSICLATASEIEKLHKEGHFPPGNMGPKIEAALRFLDHGGQRVVITDYEHLLEAVDGRAGTQIVRDFADTAFPAVSADPASCLHHSFGTDKGR
jgi:carbamate kinase